MFDDDDFREEIRAHLAMAARDRMAEGADERDASLASLKEFGNVTLTTEAARGVWTPRWLEALRDGFAGVRYAVRVLAKSPGFAVTVVAVLTLGIGANAAVFTMLKGMALTPLAGVAGSRQLGIVVNEGDHGRRSGLSYHDYRFLRDHDRAFSGLAASAVAVVNLGRGRGARPIWGELVSGNYFQVLGVRAARGRTLLPSDEIAPGRHPIVVVSDGFWRRDLGGDPDVVGRTVEINNFPLTIAGVADPAFHGTIVGYDVEAFLPVMMAPQLGISVGNLQGSRPSDVLADRGAGVLDVFGRLAPGVTFANASAQVDAVSSALAREGSAPDAPPSLSVIRIWQSPFGGQTFLLPALVVLAAMGLLVLLIACANIAGLVLVRGVSRRGELAVRLALGATRARIVGLLVLENLVLAVPGAILGMLLAAWAIPALVGLAGSIGAPQRFFFNIGVDRLVIVFSVLVGCASALVFGIVPAVQGSRIDLVTIINEDASPRGAGRGRLRAGLVVAQVAVSLLLLVGAGLAMRSLDAARRVHPGFDADHVTAVSMDVKADGYDEARGRAFYRQLLDTARADAGVESATLASTTPLNLVGTREQRIAIDGYTPRRGEDLAFEVCTIGPDYFRTLRIPVDAGRDVHARDDESGAPVVVVNRTLAHKFWGGAANAIGKRMRVGTGPWRTVVGVAGDVKYSQVTEAPHPYVYVPLFQSYRSSMILHTRGAARVEVLVDEARARIAALDPDLPIVFARPLALSMRGATIVLEFVSAMLFVFGAAGMALAGIGMYGLVSYTVKQSTHEIGIRIALGASAASVVRAFLGRGLRLGAIGAGLGAAIALALSRVVGSLLVGVSGADPISFARALAIVFGGTALAAIVPAWRAARTNPLTALRHQ